MPDENAGFDGDTFTDKGVAADFATISNLCALLDFHKRTELCLVANFATIEVYKGVNPNVSAELHVRCNETIIWK